MSNIDERVREACHRIEELYHETEGKCYISFSGGKDSTVILALVKMCQELYTIGDIPAVFSNTGVELGVTIKFVEWVKENYYPNVQIIQPELPFAWVIKHKGKPMLSKVKSKMLGETHRHGMTEARYHLMILGETMAGNRSSYTRIADKDLHVLSPDFDIPISYKCCDYLKKKPFEQFSKENDYKGNLQGIRADEGGARAVASQKRESKGGKICTWVRNGIIQKAPIIDWSNEDVDEFIEKYNVPLSEAYTKYGFDRTGCMACPYSKRLAHDLDYLYHHEPNKYKASMHWLKDVYIAQNIVLPFDEEYEKERTEKWREVYEPMRQEMLRKYRWNSRLFKKGEQMSLL